MTKAEALTAAQVDANATRLPIDVWEHVGGRLPSGVIKGPQGRFITTLRGAPAPKYVWRKVETVRPA